MTPSASTPRSLSSSTTSAASLATSVPESTEIPTSAWCRATASFTPSPRNATSRPVRRATLMIRDFWSGPIRAKMVVTAIAASSWSSSSDSRSEPFRTPVDSTPMSEQSLDATRPLSPVMIFTSTPSPRSRAIDVPASCFGRSANVRNPTSASPSSSAAVGASTPEPSRTATATTRDPSANSPSMTSCAVTGTSEHRASTDSGAPLTTSRGSPPGSSTRTDANCRSWSNGKMPRRRYLATVDATSPPDPATGADHRAWSSAFPPTGPSVVRLASLQTRPSSIGRPPSRPEASRDRANVIFPSVRVPVLSVKRISMLPRSSMATSRLTSTFLAARAREPVERLTVTMAGIISGAMPTAMAREKSRASMSGRDSATLTTKMNTVRTAATPNRNRENRDSPTSNAVCACFSPSPAAIRPNAVLVPLLTTIPRPEPWWTTVPMNAQHGRSSDSSGPSGATDFATGSDSPVSTPSSHSRSSTASSRTSAGTMAPIRSSTMSPGTRSATATRAVTPSRTTSDSWWILPRSDDMAASARYSFTKPSPTLRTTITAMITALVPPPVSPDTSAAPSRRTRIGFRIWRKRTAPARTCRVARMFGPNRRRRAAASADVRPARLPPRRSTTSSSVIRPAVARSSSSVAATAPVGARRPAAPPIPEVCSLTA